MGIRLAPPGRASFFVSIVIFIYIYCLSLRTSDRQPVVFLLLLVPLRLGTATHAQQRDYNVNFKVTSPTSILASCGLDVEDCRFLEPEFWASMYLYGLSSCGLYYLSGLAFLVDVLSGVGYGDIAVSEKNRGTEGQDL